jgi:hypothetical protein
MRNPGREIRQSSRRRWEFITGDKTFTDAGVHGTDRGGGLVCKALKIFLEEALLEAYTRVPGHNFFAQLRRKLIEASSEHIETDP